MKYEIETRETYRKVYEIEASSREEALYKLKEPKDLVEIYLAVVDENLVDIEYLPEDDVALPEEK